MADVTQILSPIFAIDIWPDGRFKPVDDAWPEAVPANGAVWRWLHCDRTLAPFAEWAKAHLSAPVGVALLQAETRPRCDTVGTGLLVTLHAINLNPGAEGEDMIALRLWATDTLLVTTRSRRLFAIDDLRSDIIAGRGPFSTGAFIARLADQITERIEGVSIEYEEATDAVEEKLLDGRPDKAGTGETEIGRISRSVIKLRRHVAPQREALGRLATIEMSVIGPNEHYALREIANRTQRTVEELDATRDRLASLRAHIDSQHAWQLGRQSFVLSVAAAIFLPLSFVTGLFGANIAGIPGTDWPYAFGTLAAACAALGVGLWLLIRWLRWL